MIEQLELKDIKVGEAYDIETKNRHYTLERKHDGFFMAGHPVFCGLGTWCRVFGSRPSGWGIPTRNVIIVGQHLHFGTDDYDDVVTSTIVAIKKVEVS